MTEVIAQYQTTRVRALWTSYKRIFQLTINSVITLDPATFAVTNTFPYLSINKLGPDNEKSDHFTFEVDKTVFLFKTAHRAQLLNQLFECIAKHTPAKLKSIGPFNAERLRKNGSRVECRLSAAPYGIVESLPSGAVVQEYRFINITDIGIDESCRGFFFRHGQRIKVFYVSDIQALMSGCKTQLKLLGIEKVTFLTQQTIAEVANRRVQNYISTGTAVSIFDVNKSTRRSLRLIPRQMQLAEEYIIEKDSSGFQYVSYQKISSIFAIVRSWTNPREFTIEYDDGSSRTYTCAVRDTLLAMLLDISHAIGNKRVIVTGEVSDGLRLMPRFAEENYQASLTDAFFGASSIENWYLTHVAKVSKTATPGAAVDIAAIEQACKELNANVPCPGIAAASDPLLVKNALRGVLCALQLLLMQVTKNPRQDNSRSMVLMLQTIYRLLTSTAGYTGFVEIREVDTRFLLLQLLQFKHDFVNYWTLLVLTSLCKCPLQVRITQQEFVNKHTLLADNLLITLVELMSSRIDVPDLDDPEAAAAEKEKHKEKEGGDKEGGDKEKEDGVAAIENGDAKTTESTSATTTTATTTVTTTTVAPPTPKGVNPNASVFAHIPNANDQRASVKDINAAPQRRKDVNLDAPVAEEVFFPNSLVVIAAAGLLESIVSSQRDTSSPELLHVVFDTMAEHCDVLIHMLRSTSFLIMENAAILMFVLLKNRKKVAMSLREMALSESLVLKNLYNAIFSPSVGQRFISRFLIATWMSGSEKVNSAKALLLRILPGGLIEYLKHTPINEEQRKNLDEIEEEFYAEFAGGARASRSNNNKAKPVSELHNRMRRRITSVLKDQAQAVEKVQYFQVGQTVAGHEGEDIAGRPIVKPIETTTAPAPAPTGPPENYRIMFHMITQDHRLPDLIWNEQTRLELRTCLEKELRDFEVEQRLRGSNRIAWNYQQFNVKYESLKDEMQIGPIYVRHFLEAGDAFLRSLETPGHTVLFEKMFRRVLVSGDTNPTIAILCARCLTRLYSACRDIIGQFDDMLLIIRMLEKYSNLELLHCLIDLVEALCMEPSNALQLLDREFVNIIIKYASLAHLNPDTIGNLLAQATSKVLMIEDSTDSPSKPAGEQQYVDEHGEPLEGAPSQHEQKRRSLWVPTDISCPKTWFVAPTGVIPPPPNKQRGPFRVSDLVAFFDKGQLDDTCLVAPCSMDDSEEDRFEAVVDTGKWRSFRDYFQLRIQMLFPGKALYSPAEVGRKALNMLSGIAAVHEASNSRNIPFFPIPQSKRIMSNMEHLSIFAQLLLCNDGEVVDTASKLLLSLVQFNDQINSKLYLTGVFFFVCRYSANNFLSLAQFLDGTHLKQSFYDTTASVARDHSVAARSVLSSMLPSALINTLAYYGSERFAAVFTGDFDTPEVIWNAALRKHLVEMIDQHLGDFPLRLKQFNLAEYDFCPIAKIHFQSLEKELYVHEYYLRNLCNETRFPNHPINEPFKLLREVLERWREEMSKGIVDSSVAKARAMLGLKDHFDNKDLRKAYKTLAKQYHPDRNPEGREMFEKIQIAYELLSMSELKATDTDLENVLLMIQAQNIIYRRYPHEVSDQKYPAFSLLVQVLQVPPLDPPVTGVDANILSAGAKLMFYTCSISPLNAKEFVKENAVEKLIDLLTYALQAQAVPETKNLSFDILTFGMKACSSISQFEIGRDCLLGFGERFVDLVASVLNFAKIIPIAVENAIETIARCCSLQALQILFVNAGVIWKLIPMLLAYDGTLQEDLSDETQREVYNQSASNMQAVVAAKALGRLGGYMFDDLASAPNAEAKAGLTKLLTEPLAKYLRNRRPWILLGALNENCEKTTKIWNVGMRKELLKFVLSVDQARPAGSRANDLEPALSFSFSAIREELCIGGVYVRIFNKSADCSDIDDPSQFCRDLLLYMFEPAKIFRQLPRLPLEHLEQSIEALRTLAHALPYIAHDVGKADNGLVTVFSLLHYCPPDSTAFTSCAKLFNNLCESQDFIVTVVRCDPPVLWKLLCALCTIANPAISNVWSGAENFCSHPEGLSLLISNCAIPHLLGVVLGVENYVNAFNSRLAAMSLLSKFLWNPVKGPEASAMLRRFLPEPLVVLLKTRVGNASLKLLDDVVENPELIWTAEMQGELRRSLTRVLKATTTTGITASFETPIELTPDYLVHYRQLSEELYVGGVYVRLFLKQPTFRLSNPVFFLEKLVEFWEASFTAQVPHQHKKQEVLQEEDSRALVLGKEDFLTLITSCIVCVMKGEPSVVDHLLSWEFPKNMTDCLKRAVDLDRRGTPIVSSVRLLHNIVNRVDVVESLALAKSDIILQLTRALNNNSNSHQPNAPVELPKDAALIADLIKKLFQSSSCMYLGSLVASAVRAGLPLLLLDHVIAVKKDALVAKEIRNASALKIHAIDILKAMMAADPENVNLRTMLDLHSAWGEYRDQSHDLFITDHEKSDPYLLQDAVTERFRGLLTNGGETTPLSSHFTASTSIYTSTMPTFATNPVAPATTTTTAPATTTAQAPVSEQQQQQQQAQWKQVSTDIMKGASGLGMDVAKDPARGVASIVNFKAMPDGIENPSLMCRPSLMIGDVIVAVNNCPCPTFAAAVQALRACPAGEYIRLTVERKQQ